MLTKKHLEAIAQFFHVELGWLEHVADKNFNCGCSYEAPYESEPQNQYCREWQLTAEIKNLEKRLEEAKYAKAKWEAKDERNQA